MVKATLTEYGAAAPWALNFGSIAAQRLLPAYVRWLQSRGPDLVVYCPVLSQASASPSSIRGGCTRKVGSGP